MFVFSEDLPVTSRIRGSREIIQRADKKRVLTVALKVPADIRTRFFANMSKRAGDLLREMEVLSAIRLREVEKAQQDIVAICRKLEEEGVIVTGAAAGSVCRLKRPFKDAGVEKFRWESIEGIAVRRVTRRPR